MPNWVGFGVTKPTKQEPEPEPEPEPKPKPEPEPETTTRNYYEGITQGRWMTSARAKLQLGMIDYRLQRSAHIGTRGLHGAHCAPGT